mmetsp:Transcript_5539/g.16325  ORF Transcript_5539/g.16325 Transcript_5539/m.16325 type:complete len:183 (+) Transcript_5539:96-644(+)
MRGYATPPTTANDCQASIQRTFQQILDRSTVHVVPRWLGLAAALCVYALRIYTVRGWFIVTYGLGIFLLNNLIGFLSPQADPESDGPLLPTAASDDYKPFARRVPEFKFWYSSTKGTMMAFGMTFFSVFDVPVFWPILLIYFFALFFLTMKRQIKHMIKYKYVPWSWGKKSYEGVRSQKDDK